MQHQMDPKSTSNESWHDITTEFKDTVSKLKLGELLKPDTFTLLEAMSAIELMDPKMDSGMVIRKVNREILSLEQSIKAGKVKISRLELDELIGIIDETFACMATWMDGNHLSQTLMTNLYMHDTDKIEDRCLRTFCQAILKSVDIMDKLVGVVYCIEEEDFMLNNGSYNLADKFNDQKVLNSLEDICQQCEKMFKDLTKSNCTSSYSNHKMTATKVTGQTVDSSDGTGSHENLGFQIDKTKIPQLGALITRIRFTQSFYAFFLNISKNLLKDHVIAPGQNPQNQAQKTIKLVQTTASNCDRYLKTCLNYFDDWRDTLDMGIKPPPLPNGARQIDGDYLTIMGFDPLINLKLIPPAYPRCLRIKSRLGTVEYLRDIVIRLRECIAISSQFHQSKSFIKPLESVERFSKYFKSRSCVISRSFLQTLYLSNRMIPLLKEELLQSMMDYCEPVTQLMKKDEPKFMALNEFLEEGAKLFSQIIIVYGHNAARQHERFTNDIIASFRNLQYSAFLFSNATMNMMVYSWTTYYYMRFCIKYVLSGFELELYSAHEYPYVFWYLYDVLIRGERDQLQQAKRLSFTTYEQTMNNEILASNGKNCKTKVKKKLGKLESMMEAFHDRHLILSEAMGKLVQGLYLLTRGLELLGFIKSSSEEYTSQKICFDHRFGLFTGNASMWPQYSNFSQTIWPSNDKLLIFREAKLCFTRATSLFEKYEGQEEFLAVSKANTVVATILDTNSDRFINKQVEFCFDKHPSLPIVKL